MGVSTMPLELYRRPGVKNIYLRGTVRGIRVFETTGTHDKKVADAIRIKREAALLNESVFGKKATVSFAEGALSYLAAGGEPKYLGKQKGGRWTGLIGHF